MCYVHVRLLGPLLLLVLLGPNYSSDMEIGPPGHIWAWFWSSYSGAPKGLPTGFTSHYEECLWFMYQHASLRSFFFEEPVPIQCLYPCSSPDRHHINTSHKGKTLAKASWLRAFGWSVCSLGWSKGVLLWLIFGTEVILQVNHVREHTQTVSAEMDPMGCFNCNRGRVLFEMTQAIWSAHSTYGTCTQWFTAMHVEIT